MSLRKSKYFVHSIEMNFPQIENNMKNFVVILQNPIVNLPVVYELNCLCTITSPYEIYSPIHKHV